MGPVPIEAIGVLHVERFLDHQTERALAPKSLPSVLSPGEVERLFTHLSGKYRLIGMTIYGTGARVSEALALRVKDIDFDLAQVADGLSCPVRSIGRIPEQASVSVGSSCFRLPD